MSVLRDASELLWPAVQQTIAELGLLGSDSAAVKLAQRYAQVIDQLPNHAGENGRDQAWGLRWLGPLLLDCLTELGATPAARARLAKGVKQPDAPKSKLEQLRQARTAHR